MTGQWEYDDGQSLNYIETYDSETRQVETTGSCLLYDIHMDDSIQAALQWEQFQTCPTTDLMDDTAILETYQEISRSIQPFKQTRQSADVDIVSGERSSSSALQIINQKRSFNEAFNTIQNMPTELLSNPAAKRVHINIDRTFTSQSPFQTLTMGFNTSLARSRGDNFIHALRQLIKCANEKSTLEANLKRTITAEGVLWVVREAWPKAEGYWNLTSTFRGFLAAELWRNFPCEKTYRLLPAEYRPTRAQLMMPHSPMVDWMPWPDIRDLAIRYQDVIDTDELFRMAILNVVAHRKNTRKSKSYSSVDNVNPTSFRVWDLACLEKQNGTDPLADPTLRKRPSLHSRDARAIVRAFDLEYDQFSTQKLDHCFFKAFPMLQCESAYSHWQVKDFQNTANEDVGYPNTLTRPAVMRLKSKIEQLIGSSIEI